MDNYWRAWNSLNEHFRSAIYVHKINQLRIHHDFLCVALPALIERKVIRIALGTVGTDVRRNNILESTSSNAPHSTIFISFSYLWGISPKETERWIAANRTTRPIGACNQSETMKLPRAAVLRRTNQNSHVNVRMLPYCGLICGPIKG